MHWSEEIATQIIKNSPNKEEYVCAAGISPSGSVHIGNFRDIATSYFVCRALRKMGKKAKLLFSWDEYDRLRKVPVNVAEITEGFEKYIGVPYADVPDPYGCCESYAKHFENEFEKSLARFGIEVDFRYQAKEYRSGRYTEYIIKALKERKQIFDILDSFRTQEATADERENYYPINIYCPQCKKDETKIVSLNEDCTKAHFVCKCGYEGEFDFTQNYNCKLAWKIDWPMRWKVEGVDFEPGGKDHASPTGSFQTSRIIADKIFGYKAPMFQAYEFIGIKGTTGKMSGSSGLNLTPETLLKLYQPELILWLYSKTEPTKAFDFCFSDEILRQYFEYDKMQAQIYDGTANEYIESIMFNTTVKDRKPELVPMAQLVSFGSIVDFNADMLETIFTKIGTPFTKEQFAERLSLAKYWLEQCSPESMNKLLTYHNWNYYDTMTQEEKDEIELLRQYLVKGEFNLNELQTFLYDIPCDVRGEMDDKTKKAVQGKFFKNVYQLTIGKERGPRLYLFLYAIDKNAIANLLDFSGEREEMPIVEEVNEEEIFANDVAPIKEEIQLDAFQKIDMRVCKIIACEDVKKSKNFLKLTLNDGIGTRTIMSTIKGEYTPEELIGKKIIVIANLAPHKFSGVMSEGMLIAATHDSCGCKVIFVDDSVPEGTPIA